MIINGTPVPGTEPWPSTDRDFVYIETKPGEDGNDITDWAADDAPETDLSRKSGGTFRFFFELTLPDGSIFSCYTFRGDLAGWRNSYLKVAQEHQRRWGRATADTFETSDGRSFPLAECQITYVR